MQQSSPSILIIDDEEELCLLLEAFLKKKSRAISSRHTLTTGFEQFSAQQPDILFLDNNLPDGLGIDNIAKFRELRPKLIIAMISAMSNLKNDAIDRGADFFIEKPVSFAQLNKVVESWQLV